MIEALKNKLKWMRQDAAETSAQQLTGVGEHIAAVRAHQEQHHKDMMARLQALEDGLNNSISDERDRQVTQITDLLGEGDAT